MYRSIFGLVCLCMLASCSYLAPLIQLGEEVEESVEAESQKPSAEFRMPKPI